MADVPKNDPRSISLPVLVSPKELIPRTMARLVRVHDKFGRLAERMFARHGLSSAQFDVLATLDHGEGITQQELAERLLVTKGNVCGLIDRMESAGLVERRPDPGDRRANRIYLTDQGRRRLAETEPDRRSLVRQTLGRLDPEQLQTLHDLLGRLEADEPGA
jgi:MarR family transcriptional regulator, organic hydroperoxide resistance regulator